MDGALNIHISDVVLLNAKNRVFILVNLKGVWQTIKKHPYMSMKLTLDLPVKGNTGEGTIQIVIVRSYKVDSLSEETKQVELECDFEETMDTTRTPGANVELLFYKIQNT